MRSHQDHYIHELSVDMIQHLLKHGAWQVGDQSIKSAVTNDNDLSEPNAEWLTAGENTGGINAFSDIKFDDGVKKILDVGGGKFDCNRNYLKRERNIELLVWDPYNRSSSHNQQVQTEVEKEKVSAVTSMSVLNVIPEVTVRLAHITTLKAALIVGGKAYIKIWPGEQPLQGTYLPSATDSYYQANAYADRFLREVEVVFGIGNVRLDNNIPNLIVAVKTTESHTPLNEIAYLQKKSEMELELLTHIREQSLRKLYATNNIYKLFSTNLSFFQKMENAFIKENRHFDPQLQREYDRRFGVVPCLTPSTPRLV